MYTPPNKQQWHKEGLVYSVKGANGWDLSHTQVPVVDIDDPLGWRIYYASRDSYGNSRTGYIIVEVGNPQNIIYKHKDPILDLGNIGGFDDCGVMPSSIITSGDVKYLYYTGWTKKVVTPYHNSVGLALSYDNGKTFKQLKGPVISTTVNEPYFSGTGYVLHNDIWHMWYLSCMEWTDFGTSVEPRYNIKYATSFDGIKWNQTGYVAIDCNDDECVCNASVIKDLDICRMWYCYRKINDYKNGKNSYKIGYVESYNNRKLRKYNNILSFDKDSSYDDKMMCYPNVIQYKDKLYMFYNGNGFGESGILYATSHI